MKKIDVEQVKQYINDQYAIAYPDPGYRPYQALEVRETSDEEMAATYPLQVLVAGYTDTSIEPSWENLSQAEVRKIMKAIGE